MQSSFCTSCLKIKKSYCGSASGEWFYKFVEIYKFPISAFSFHTFSGGTMLRVRSICLFHWSVEVNIEYVN